MLHINLPNKLHTTETYWQGSPYHYPESPVTYEDQIATQILTQFPEITNVLGQILDENSQ